MILIISSSGDLHTDVVVEELGCRGIPHIRLNTEDLSSVLSTTSMIGTCKDHWSFYGKHLDLDLVRDHVSSVWYRRPAWPDTSGLLDPDDRKFAEAEWKHLLKSFYTELQDRFWVSSLDSIDRATPKPYQLKIAQAIGFNIPRTIISNSSEDVLRFWEACDGRVVYKTLTAHTRGARAQRGILTNIVDGTDLKKRLGQICHAPCLFQEYIEKCFELRVTVVGRRAFAARIDSQLSQRSRIDWRRYDVGNSPYTTYKLAPDDTDKMLHLLDFYGLKFGCLDLIVTPDQRLVFLEINPNGQWYWIENLTGLPIRQSLVSMLTHAKADYPV